MYPAVELVRDRYVPFRVENGKRMPFETSDFFELRAPFDGARIAMVGLMKESDARENLDTLRSSFAGNMIPKTHERIAVLKRAARRLNDRREAFADLIAWEGGKPLKDARIEVARAVSSLECAAEEAGRLHGLEVPMRATEAAGGRIAFTYPEPIGVVLAISAFNHPLNLIVHQTAPAIAAGCPVMVKPALETPLSCLSFLEVLYEAGLPAAMAAPLIAENAVVEKIAVSPEIAYLSFIGSAKVGWHLRSRIAPGTRLQLEHGGSAPVIIDRDADLERAIPALVRGGYYHSGQVCVSVQRILAHEEIADEFIKLFSAAVRELKTGDPRLATTDCGPIIRGRDIERIAEVVAEAVGAGARIEVGGGKLPQNCFEPTVVVDAPDGARIMREELFGPVTVVNRFRELDEAISAANDVVWSFQAAVFGRDLDRLMAASRRLRASAVMVNDATTFRVDWMPFRGDGPSGLGTGGIPATMRDMTKEKLVVLKTPAFQF